MFNAFKRFRRYVGFRVYTRFREISKSPVGFSKILKYSKTFRNTPPKFTRRFYKSPTDVRRF